MNTRDLKTSELVIFGSWHEDMRKRLQKVGAISMPPDDATEFEADAIHAANDAIVIANRRACLAELDRRIPVPKRRRTKADA